MFDLVRLIGPSGSGFVGKTLRALRHRNFRLFFFGQLVSLIGSWMQGLAQSWLLWRMTESAWLLGLLGFCQMVPILFLGFVGGVVADRFSRYRVVLLTQTAAAVQATLLAVLTLTGRINVTEILVLAGMLGVINAFDMPVRHAFLIQMVGKEDLGNAIALNSSIFNGARIIGPALAGILVKYSSEGACFAVNAVSFIAVLGGLLAMRVEEPPRREIIKSALGHLKEGFVYAWRTPHVRTLLGLLTLTSLVAMPYSSLLPAIVGGVLKRDSAGLGTLMSAAGIGALAGALSMASRSGVHGLGRLAGWMATSFGLTLICLSFSVSFWLSAIIMLVIGFCMMTQLACINTLLQSLVPEDFRGRLMSQYTVAFLGVAPLGSLMHGEVASEFGPQVSLAAGGVITVFAGLMFLRTVTKNRGEVQRLAAEAGVA